MEADAVAGAGPGGEQRGFEQTLEVDGEIERRAAESAPGIAHARPLAAVEQEDLVDVGITFDEHCPFRIDGPGETRGGETALERGHGRQGVDDVAHCAEADSENAGGHLARTRHPAPLVDVLNQAFETRFIGRFFAEYTHVRYPFEFDG